MPESNNSDNPPPETSIFDPRYWAPLKIAFGRYVDLAGGRIVGAHNEALGNINRNVHKWQLRLGFRAPDDTIRVPNAVECRKLDVKAGSDWEAAVWIEPHHDEPCYAWRADLERLTTIPAAPAAHAGGELEPVVRVEESMIESVPAAPEPEPARNPGGRDPEHEWERAACYVDERIESKGRPLDRHLRDNKPNIQSAADLMDIWFAKHDPKPPINASIRRWLNKKENWSRIAKWWGSE